MRRDLVVFFCLAALVVSFQNCGEPMRSASKSSLKDELSPGGGPLPPTPPGPGPLSPLLQAFDVGVVYSTTVFVALTGSDSGAGTRANPYRTLQRALQGATPGTEVVLLAGTYPALGSVGGLAGSASAPFKIRGEGLVVINATAGPTGLSLSDPRYVVIENLTIQNSPIHGMNVDDGGSYSTPGEFLVLRNVHFRNIGSGSNNDCLKMSGIDRFHIERSSFENCNMGEAIDMVGCHNGIITGSTFRNIPQHAVQAKGGSADVVIHGNTFQDIAGHAINLGGSTDPALMRPLTASAEGLRIRAYANIIRRALTAAAFIACHDCEFTNNTVVDFQRWPLRILQGGSDGQLFSSRSGLVYNNIFYFQMSQALVNIGVGTEPNTFSFSNNLWFSTTAPGFSGPTLGDAGPEQNAVIQQNPAFANAGAGDFRLTNSSPARGAGRSVNLGSYGDFVGQAYLNPPALGAHEAH